MMRSTAALRCAARSRTELGCGDAAPLALPPALALALTPAASDGVVSAPVSVSALSAHMICGAEVNRHSATSIADR